MFTTLNNIHIVLVETSHPGNIGAAARAIKTMGLSRLSLVSPLDYPCAEATARASGADDILAQAQVYDALEDALSGSTFAIGTSARERRLQWPSYAPDEAAQQLLARAEDAEVALVFGRERYGLTNEELARCQALVTIDANPAYSSLNLAAAVQIMSYELRRQLISKDATRKQVCDPLDPAATSAQIEGMYTHLEQTLNELGVIKKDQPKATLIRRFRRLFSRTGLHESEINILRGLFSAAQGKKQDRRK